MPTYVMLTTLGPDGWATVRENPDRIREVTDEVESMGLTVVVQYGLMGQYDFLNVIEAPDEATMAKAAITLAARGTMRTTTYQAISIPDLIASLKAAT
ncbi:MAG: GYD domain-containing protein [Acidimicrobiia bacterium]